MAVKRVVALVIMILMVGILAGCAEVRACANDPNCIPSAVELTRIAVEMPDSEIKVTVQDGAIERYVAAQEAQARANAAQAIANQAASEAAQHIAVMTQIARATTDSLSVRATDQALDADLTRQAQVYYSEETRQAGDARATVQARQATVTAQSVEATREAQESTRQAADAIARETVQAIAAEETRVVVVYEDNATRVSVEATVTAVAWDGKMERVVKPIMTGVGIVSLVTLVAGVFVLVWRFAQVLETRLHIVSPPVNTKESIVIDRLTDGAMRLLLPYRTVNPAVTVRGNDVDSPLIAPSVAAQMAATLAQQKANYARARQTGSTT